MKRHFRIIYFFDLIKSNNVNTHLQKAYVVFILTFVLIFLKWWTWFPLPIFDIRRGKHSLYHLLAYLYSFCLQATTYTDTHTSLLPVAQTSKLSSHVSSSGRPWSPTRSTLSRLPRLHWGGVMTVEEHLALSDSTAWSSTPASVLELTVRLIF